MDQVAEVVQTCVDRIWTAGDYYGLQTMRVDAAGRLRVTEGARSIRIKVRLVYDRSGDRQVREATVVCVVQDNGDVHVLPPESAYSE